MKFRKKFTNIGEFWTTSANNKSNFDNKTANVCKSTNMFDEIKSIFLIRSGAKVLDFKGAKVCSE
jgi:hypothetical protein